MSLIGNEVLRIVQLPLNPDADCSFYAVNGKRLGYLGTTPASHPQGMPVYKVETHPFGTTFPPNGLPVFNLHYRNDDGGPGYSKDSRLFFDPPADGEYIVRIGDARNEGGPNFGLPSHSASASAGFHRQLQSDRAERVERRRHSHRRDGQSHRRLRWAGASEARKPASGI